MYAPHFVSPFVRVGLYAPTRPSRWPFFYPVCWSLLDCTPPLTSGYTGYTNVPPPPPLVEPDVEATGSLLLDVQPTNAQVFVDGYYVGEVADVLQMATGVNLPSGAHRIEFRAPGYAPLVVDVQIPLNGTIKYRAALKRAP